MQGRRFYLQKEHQVVDNLIIFVIVAVLSTLRRVGIRRACRPITWRPIAMRDFTQRRSWTPKVGLRPRPAQSCHSTQSSIVSSYLLQEDEKLVDLISKAKGSIRWGKLASNFLKRTQRSCKARYFLYDYKTIRLKQTWRRTGIPCLFFIGQCVVSVIDPYARPQI